MSDDTSAWSIFQGVAFPTDRWLRLAETKFSRGYVLIVHPTRINSNFYRKDKGYEPCPYRIARFLIKNNLVEPIGEQYMGVVYRPYPDVQLVAKPLAPSQSEEPAILMLTDMSTLPDGASFDIDSAEA